MRIRKVYPGSGLNLSDPGSNRHRIRDPQQRFRHFSQILVTKLLETEWDVNCGFSIQFFHLETPDPGVNKHRIPELQH